MSQRIRSSHIIVLLVGVVAGLLLMSFAPLRGVQAVATDRGETFALATGSLGSGVEALFMLDGLTGELRAVAINPNKKQFTVELKANVAKDMKIEEGKAPKFIMVTGACDLRSQGLTQYGDSVVYVAEMTTGQLMVYAMPFNANMLNSNSPNVSVPLLPMGPPAPIRTTAVRP